MEIKFIKGNKVAWGAFRKTFRKLRVAEYCRVSTDSEDQIKSYNSMICLLYTSDAADEL